MSVALITKGMICQGHLIVNRIQKFILPLSLQINNKTKELHISRNSNEVNIINSSMNISFNSKPLKANFKNTKTIKFHIKKICG